MRLCIRFALCFVLRGIDMPYDEITDTGQDSAYKKFKDGGVSVCFACQRQLIRAKGGFIFEEIQDPAGNRIRVHKQCVNRAIGDGYTKVE